MTIVLPCGGGTGGRAGRSSVSFAPLAPSSEPVLEAHTHRDGRVLAGHPSCGETCRPCGLEYPAIIGSGAPASPGCRVSGCWNCLNVAKPRRGAPPCRCQPLRRPLIGGDGVPGGTAFRSSGGARACPAGIRAGRGGERRAGRAPSGCRPTAAGSRGRSVQVEKTADLVLIELFRLGVLWDKGLPGGRSSRKPGRRRRRAPAGRVVGGLRFPFERA